jgi:hypothetical protein
MIAANDGGPWHHSGAMSIVLFTFYTAETEISKSGRQPMGTVAGRSG